MRFSVGVAVTLLVKTCLLARNPSSIVHASTGSEDFLDPLRALVQDNRTAVALRFGAWSSDTTPNPNTAVTRTYGELFFRNNTDRLQETMRKQFESMDSNEDGSLTRDEYMEAARKLAERMLAQGQQLSKDMPDIDGAAERSGNMTQLVQSFLSSSQDLPLSFAAFDVDKNGNVTAEEYVTSGMSLWNHTITLQPELCEQARRRVHVCRPEFLDLDELAFPNQEPAVNVTLEEVLWVEDAQCRVGMSAISGYRFQQCLLDARCDQVKECFAKTSTSLMPEGQSAQKSSMETMWTEMTSLEDRSKHLWKGIVTGTLYAALFGVGLITLIGSSLVMGWAGLVLKSLGVVGDVFKKAPILKKIALAPVLLAVDILFTIITVLSIVMMLFGIVGIINVFQSTVVVPKTFAALHMPKLDFSGKVSKEHARPSGFVEPQCEMFAYWPKHCQAQLVPGTGVRRNKTLQGRPLRDKICDHGGELWSGNACRYVVGFGDDWSAPCGFAGLGCRPMCYKVNLDGCSNAENQNAPAPSYIYANSSMFLSPWATQPMSPMNPYMFTTFGAPQDDKHYFMLDQRPVETFSDCQAHCDRWTPAECDGFIVQAPSLDYPLSLKCTVLVLRKPSEMQDRKEVTDFRQLVGSGQNSVAEDDRWAPFVVAMRSGVLPSKE